MQNLLTIKHGTGPWLLRGSAPGLGKHFLYFAFNVISDGGSRGLAGLKPANDVKGRRGEQNRSVQTRDQPPPHPRDLLRLHPFRSILFSVTLISNAKT